MIKATVDMWSVYNVAGKPFSERVKDSVDEFLKGSKDQRLLMCILKDFIEREYEYTSDYKALPMDGFPEDDHITSSKDEAEIKFSEAVKKV